MGKLMLAANGTNNLLSQYGGAYVYVPSIGGYVRKDAFMSELAQLEPNQADQFLSENAPEYLGLDPATIGVIVTTAGKAISFVKGILSKDQAANPGFIVSPSKILAAASADQVKGMVTSGNAVYFGGKIFLTEQGQNNLLAKRTSASAAFIDGLINSFPFTVPDAWKSTFSGLEVKEAPPALPAPTPTPTGGTLAPTTPGAPVRTGIMASFQPGGGIKVDTRAWYEKPITWVIGGTLLLGGIYLATRPKSKK